MRKEKNDSPTWMSYNEALAWKKLKCEQEQKLLESWGLGWLRNFCSIDEKTKEIEKDNDLKKENEY